MNNELSYEIQRTGGILKKYIEVHNSIFNTPTGLIGKLKKIFKPMNFGDYVSRLKPLSKELTESNKELKNLSHLKGNDIEVQSVLIDYNESLIDTIDSLEIMCSGLEKKSRNESYSMSEYQSDLSNYNKCVDHYRNLGTILNETIYGI